MRVTSKSIKTSPKRKPAKKHIVVQGRKKTLSKKSHYKLDKKLKIGIVFGAIAAVFLIFVAIANIIPQAPIKVSDQFLTYIKASDSASAYTLLSNDAKSDTSYQNFKLIIDRIGPILNGSSTQTNQEITTNNNISAAKIVYSINGTDGSGYILTVYLTKPNSKWLVDDFNSVQS